MILPWSEIFGFSALILGVFGLQMRRPRIALIFLTLMSVFWTLHFLLLAQWVAAITSVIAVCRNFSAVKFSEDTMRRIVVLSFVACVLFAVPTYQSWHDSLPLFAMFWTSAAVYFREKPVYFRLSCITGDITWLSYAILISSLSFGLTSALFLLSSVIALLRYNILPHYSTFAIRRIFVEPGTANGIPAVITKR